MKYLVLCQYFGQHKCGNLVVIIKLAFIFVRGNVTTMGMYPNCVIKSFYVFKDMVLCQYFGQHKCGNLVVIIKLAFIFVRGNVTTMGMYPNCVIKSFYVFKDKLISLIVIHNLLPI